MKEQQKYEYHVVLVQPTKVEIDEKKKSGWEVCDTPEGVIGRDLEKEPTYTHSKFYFRRKIETLS